MLLGRLGAGGMGVVYLARSPDGTHTAVKLVRAEYAADPAFRTRFRRETEASARLSGRWLVPVVDADPEAVRPWLATPFVPGPSLAAAVDGYGPLPEPGVRTLGAGLAEALAGVHAAGLVHRDVKPGNVLLALDGPRLIDFGIARADGGTALTATGLVLGSPGFLSPEQAQARSATAGPPSDVFALGCVLAYAATGRRPFAAATVAGSLFRTVHEEPDLAGAPAALLPLLRACLAKSPADRPGTAAVREQLAAGLPPGADLGWLPAPLPGLIAERTSAVLALPTPEPPPPEPPPPEPPPPEPPPPEPPTLAIGPATGSATGPATGPAKETVPGDARPTRRRVLRLGAGLGAAAAAGAGLFAVQQTWTGDGDSDGDGDGGGKAALPRYTIGLHADLSGAQRESGQAQERGARLAVARFNAADDRPFDLGLTVRDDRGEARTAAQVADRFAADPQVAAVLGPTGDAGFAAAAGRYEEALLPMVTVSAPTSLMTLDSRQALFQLRPATAELGSAIVRYLGAVEHITHTAVVDDRAATGDEDGGLVERIQQAPPSRGRVTVHQVAADEGVFDTVAAAVRKSGARAVVYAGSSPTRAARCARALRRGGFDGPRMVPEPVLRPERGRFPFLAEAGDAAEGWLCAATYTDPGRLPAARGFTEAYAERFPDAPDPGPAAPCALEAYDALLLLARSLRRPADGGPERGSTATRLRAARYDGLAKPIDFDPDAGQFVWSAGLFLYVVERGAMRFLGHYREVTEPVG
ncbi:bifunctional serine/threonine-protein kinase/ABC transporter substrate-binding protein [Streptomyces sp. B-S-A8]|uniref:Bifunctional serine/threonine-protein kinase/ABC transporter substrate-binding protein n=1 Tax=Streptomyces solicavernae TaxID=3043614 RepID=A0ABT6RJS9_9ACTN|nr:bifunctional serine/threonine-protein kinase/ABC transporter substrate-binding protein [Streptomyces sp. B-S-A8]MDI3384677.1 bifunctional serine/threonine-protein kinase/ABC transporter substrate-binding protein [Streptomyces sp. B-S-A8]